MSDYPPDWPGFSEADNMLNRDGSFKVQTPDPASPATPTQPATAPTGDRRALAEAAAAFCPSWQAYFTIHADPMVVPTTSVGPMHRIADVSIAPADYGKAYCEHIGANGPDVILADLAELEALRTENERLSDVLRAIVNDSNTELVEHMRWIVASRDDEGRMDLTYPEGPGLDVGGAPLTAEQFDLLRAFLHPETTQSPTEDL